MRDAARCGCWEGMLAWLGMPGAHVRAVVLAEGGLRVHVLADGLPPDWLADSIAVRKRLPRDWVRVEAVPSGTPAGDLVVIHVRSGSRTARIPQEA